MKSSLDILKKHFKIINFENGILSRTIKFAISYFINTTI